MSGLSSLTSQKFYSNQYLNDVNSEKKIPSYNAIKLTRNIKECLFDCYDFNDNMLLKIINDLPDGCRAIKVDNNEFKHLIIVFKELDNLESAIVNIGKKTCFAKGAFAAIPAGH